MKLTKIIFLLISAFLTGSSLGCNPSAKKILIKGRQIWVDDAPYFIKGICYNPVPKGSEKRDFNTLETDLKLMVEAGINTLRVYSPIEDKSVLDKIEAAGIKVIINIGYDQQGYYDLITKSYINYVEKYKDHNAILLWELGNEYNYHPEWFDGDIKKWYVILNQAAKTIHQIDRNHPVSSAHGELPDSLAFSICTDLDLWGLNVYRWDNPNKLFEQWQELSDKPLYFSEAGSDSYMTTNRDGFIQGENQKAQSVANSKIVDAVFQNAHLISGLTLFSFSDEWWKAGNPQQQDIGGFAPNSSGVPYDGSPNEEYWGIVDIDRNKKESFHVLKEQYKNFDLKKQTPH